MSLAPSVREEPDSVPPRRVLLHLEDRALSDTVRDTLAAEGFDVRIAGQFHELAAWLILWRDAVTLVIALSSVEFFRKAVLRDVRRLAPTARVIALVPSVTPEVERDAAEARVDRILTTGATPAELAAACS